MSIDIHKLKNGRADELLISLSDAECAELLPALDLFTTKTGLCLDEYGDLTLHTGLRPLLEVVELLLNQERIYHVLAEILRKAENDGYGIIFLGD